MHFETYQKCSAKGKKIMHFQPLPYLLKTFSSTQIITFENKSQVLSALNKAFPTYFFKISLWHLPLLAALFKFLRKKLSSGWSDHHIAPSGVSSILS